MEEKVTPQRPTTEPWVTPHACARVRQRGYRDADVDLVLAYGTEAREGVMLTRADVDRAVARLKNEMRCLERLRGTAVIIKNEAVLTLYRPGKQRWRRLSGKAAPRGRSVTRRSA